MKRVERLFCSDLDGTLIDPEGADPGALRRFREWATAPSAPALAFVTGRHTSFALEGIAEAGLVLPDHLVTNVGTSLHTREGEEFRPDAGYAAHLRRQVGPVPLIEVDGLALALPGVRPQPGERCSEFKRSFFVDADLEVEPMASRIAEDFSRRGGRASLVASRDPFNGDGLIDVLPEGITKATAVAHLRDHHHLEDEAVVFCGDSGNDLAALRGPWHGVLVGNAEEDVRRKVLAGGPPGRRTRTVNAHGRVLEGVLEGLADLGWASV